MIAQHPTKGTAFSKWFFKYFLGGLVFAILPWFPILEPARSQGQPPSAQQALPEGKPIRSLSVISPRGFSSEDIHQVTGIKIGEPYSTTRIRQGIERLYRTGNFRDILVETEPKEDGIQVTFTLVDKPTISEVRLSGNRTFSSQELQRAMQLKIGDEFTNDGWKTALVRLLDHYRQLGFFTARIVSETSTIEKENRVILDAKIQEGQRAKVREILFHGDSVFPTAKLATLMKTAAGGPYQPDQLEDDLKNLDQFYAQEGYLKATVGPPKIRYLESTNDISVRVPIDAGTRLKVIFMGNANIPSEILKKQLLIWEERSYDTGVLGESARKLERFYQSQGYLFAKVEYQVGEQVENQPSSEAVAVKFKISEGQRVTIEEITIEGNQAIGSGEIRKRMNTKESGLFTTTILNRTVLDNDKAAILALYRSKGYLEAGIEEAIPFNRDQTQMSIILRIKEGPQVMVQKVLFDGNSALSDQDLLKAMALKEGMPYNEGQTRLDRFSLLALYAQNGYLSAQIDLKTTLSEDKQRIKLVYKIQER